MSFLLDTDRLKIVLKEDGAYQISEAALMLKAEVTDADLLFVSIGKPSESLYFLNHHNLT